MTTGCGCRPYDGGRCKRKVRFRLSDVMVLLLLPAACCGVVQVIGGSVGVPFVLDSGEPCPVAPRGKLLCATVEMAYTAKLKITSSEKVIPLMSIRRPMRRDRLD